MNVNFVAKGLNVLAVGLIAGAAFAQNVPLYPSTQYRPDLGPTPVGNIKGAFEKKGQPIPDSIPDAVMPLRDSVPVAELLDIRIGGESIPNGCRFFVDVENLSRTAQLGATVYALAVYVGPDRFNPGESGVMELKQMGYPVSLAPRTAARKAYDVTFTDDQRVADPSLAAFKSCDDAYFTLTWAREVRFNKEHVSSTVADNFLRRAPYGGANAVKFAFDRNAVMSQWNASK